MLKLGLCVLFSIFVSSITFAADQLVEQWTSRVIAQNPLSVLGLKAVTHNNAPTDVLIHLAGATPQTDELLIYSGATLVNTQYISVPSSQRTDALNQLVSLDHTFVAIPSPTLKNIRLLGLPITHPRGYPDYYFEINTDKPVETLEWSKFDSRLLLARTAKDESYLIHLHQPPKSTGGSSPLPTQFEVLKLPRVAKYQFFPGGLAYFAENDPNLALSIVHCTDTCQTLTAQLPASIKKITALSYTAGNRQNGSVIDSSFLIFDETTGVSTMIDSNTGRALNTFTLCTYCNFLTFETSSPNEGGGGLPSEASRILLRDRNGGFLVYSLFDGKLKFNFANPKNYVLANSQYRVDQIFGSTLGFKNISIDLKTGNLVELDEKASFVTAGRFTAWLFDPQPTTTASQVVKVTPFFDSMVSKGETMTGQGKFYGANLLANESYHLVIATRWWLAPSSSSIVVWTRWSDKDNKMYFAAVPDALAQLSTYDSKDDGIYFMTNGGRLKYLRFESVQ